MPAFSRRSLAKTAVRLLQAQPGKQRDVARSLAAYLKTTKRTKHQAALVKDIARELSAQNSILFAEVRSAFALARPQRDQIVAYLQRETGVKTVELDEYVEPELLSGVIIRTPDREIDLSARHQLKQLASLTLGGN